MIRKIIFIAGVLSVSFAAQAQNGNGGSSQGASNGQPFQELQEVIDAADAALQSAIDANTSAISAEEASRIAGDAAVAAQAAADLAAEIQARLDGDELLQGQIDMQALLVAANAAAVQAEVAARMAQDAALQAEFSLQLTLEAQAREAGDLELMDLLEAEELARIEGDDLLGTQFLALEDRFEVDELNYVEHEGVFDIASLREDLFNLNFGTRDWLYISSWHAPSNRRSAICVGHAGAYGVISTFVTGGSLTRTLNTTRTFVQRNGSRRWSRGPVTLIAQPNMLRAYSTRAPVNTMLIDRSNLISSNGLGEIMAYSGYAPDNTATISKGSSRREACGF